MSMLDPRSDRCPIGDLCNLFPGICKYHITCLYYGLRNACIHPDSEDGQTRCPLGLVKESDDE